MGVGRRSMRLRFSLACVAAAGIVTLGGMHARAQGAAPAAAPAATPAAQKAAPAAQSSAAGAASPTDVVGIWQGTLHIAQANRDLRIENKITRDDKGNLKVVDYSVDQGSQPLPANKASFEDGVFKYSIDAIEGKYEGKMSADGKTIAGEWTQGPNPLELDLARVTADAAWPIPEPPKPMAADAHPSFDVATVKPSKPGTPGKLFTFRGRHAITINTNMNDLISFAYGLHSKQIIGAPDWFGNDLFDIDGTPDTEGQPNSAQFKEMMQKLLAERFGLKFHHDQRELSVYIVTVAPGGPKLEKSDTPISQGQGFFFRGMGDLNVTNNTITDFAHGMQGAVMDKPVVDHTGLTDRYNFHLKWTPDDSQFGQFRGTATPQPPPAGDNPDAPPSLYTAMPEQIGLKIEAGKAMDDVIVIDNVEKPSAN
jgi:uncharacterized protein (TIGR03435 family)